MDTRQILILLNIGGMDVSNKCIDSVSVDRNFSDVGDKFSITLVDSPDTEILYDLELFMASGYRSLILRYGDISKNKLVSYTGTIWDYTNTFVGNIKKLTITGLLNRYISSQEGAASYTYNIDWNSYFNKRRDESKNYGAIDTLLYRTKLADSYANLVAEAESKGDNSLQVFTSSDILDPTFKGLMYSNAQTLTITGPSKNTISLPIPDSFVSLTGAEVPEDVTSEDFDKEQYKKYYNIIHDTNNSFWGELELPRQTTANTEGIYYPTMYGYDMKFFVPKSFKPNRYADKTIKLDKHFFSNLDGFMYNELPKAMKNNALSTEYWLPSHVKDIMGYEYTDKNKNSWYGKFDPQKTKSITVNETLTIQVIWNENMKIVGAYYVLKDPSTGLSTTYGPYIATKQDGWERVTAEWKKMGYFFGAKIYTADSRIETTKDGTSNYYWKDSKGKIRAIMFTDTASGDRNFYVQANPNAKNSTFGGAGILNSGVGVDISRIVECLAILEGWKLRRNSKGVAIDIVQTDLCANSDAFIMQNQTAMEFISENLVPRSVTPVGEYTDTSGKKRAVGTPQAGFYPFFDDDGYFHYQPLTEKSVKDLDIPNLGYNIPNSPVLSFQINTKGTAFYTFNNIDLSPMSIVTGGTVSGSVELIDDNAAAMINASRHNDTFDAWLGLTYKDVEKYATDKTSGEKVYTDALKLAQNALVTSPYALINKSKTELLSSGVVDAKEARKRVAEAATEISKKTIKATMNLWGNFEIAPARIITITNMLKGGSENHNYPVKHPSSGKYLILSMQDRIDSSGFIQSLNLVRFSNDDRASLNSYKIDYSKPASFKASYTMSEAAKITEAAVNAVANTLDLNGGSGGGHWF